MNTIISFLERQAQTTPQALAFTFLDRRGAVIESWTWHALQEKMVQAASYLTHQCGLARGDLVAIVTEPAHEFIPLLLGALYAGQIPVPLPPARDTRSTHRLCSLIAFSKASALIAREFLHENIPCFDIRTVKEHAPLPVLFNPHPIAYLQFTSGSTDAPKGVIISHESILANEYAIRRAFGHEEGMTVVGWLPLSHDMGLIGHVLQPIFAGLHSVILSPTSFLLRPITWLEAIATYQAHTSGGPDFGYQYCLSHLCADMVQPLDLSCWKVAYNGSEPVNLETIDAFAAMMAETKFSKEAFSPCYGLAEATLLVSMNRRTVSGFSLGSRTVVSCGKPAEGMEVAIFDPETGQPVEAGKEGEIALRSKSCTSGYWNNPEASQSLFYENAYLRTGDRGFVHDEELFITGRYKDTLIWGGKKYFSEEIEGFLRGAFPAVRPFVAVALADEREQLIILIEAPSKKSSVHEAAESIPLDLITASIEQEFGMVPAVTAVIAKDSLPKTTSGKIQRHQALDQWTKNALPILLQYVGPLPTDIRTVLHRFLPSIQDHESLVAAGLDSLKATALQHELVRAGFSEIPLSILLESTTTPSILARKTQRASSHSRQDSSFDEGPLTWQQERLYLHQHLNPSDTSLIIRATITLNGAVDHQAFAIAWEHVARAHPAFRSCFIQKKDGAQALVQSFTSADDVPVALGTTLLSFDDSPLRFDLSRAPLFRSYFQILSPTKSVLYLEVHHIIADGWSLRCYLEQLCSSYRAAIRKEQLPLLPATSPITVALTQRRSTTSVPHEFFEKPLPADLFSVWRIGSSRRVSSVTRHCPIRSHEWKELCARLKTTPAVILLLVYHQALYSMSSQNTTCVGVMDSQRTTVDRHDLLTCLVELRPTIAMFDASASLSDLISHLSAQVHSGDPAPFQTLLDALKPERLNGVHPLFQAAFVVQNAPSSFALSESTVGTVHILPPEESPYDITIECLPLADGSFDLRFELCEALLPAFGRGFIDHMMLLCEQLPTLDPKSPLHRGNTHYQLLQQQLLSSPAATPIPPSIIEPFCSACHLHADRLALVDGAVRWTYAEFFNVSLHYAASLNRGEVIAIPAIRSAHTIAAILGTLLAGATYLPFDDSLPQEPLEELLSRAGANAVLCPSAIPLSYRGSLAVRTISDRARETVANDLSPNEPAYILFTSGSTGEPKGVCVSHGSLSTFCHAAVNLFQLSPKDRMLQFCTLQWDTSNEEIFPTLLTGACLVLRSNQPVESVDALLSLTLKEELSVWNLPTSYFVECVKTMLRHRQTFPPSLRCVIIGGEQLSPSAVAICSELLEGHPVTLLNTYGLTECTSISLAAPLDLQPSATRYLPIGKALPGTCIAIVDESGRPLPPYAIGTLHIGGSGLALSVSGSSASPFSPLPTMQLWNGPSFSTKDIAYYEPSGVVTYINRGAEVVKRHGVRIAPAMIEQALLSSPHVQMASVITFDHHDAPFLLAAVVSCHLSSLSEQDVWDDLRSKLNVHYLPDAVLLLPSLPRLKNGKINQSAVIDSYLSRPQEDANHEDPLLQQVVAIWQELLGHQSVSADRSFFECGGNSLLLLTLREKLEQQFALSIDVAELFTASSCESQAALVRAKQSPSLEK